MKLRVFLCISYGILVAFYARGSTSSPVPFFEVPSYIDMDYKSPLYDQRSSSYGCENRFDVVLHKYLNREPTIRNADDSRARLISQREEAEAYKKYLEGAAKFVTLEYEDALRIFTELKNTKSSLKKKPNDLSTNQAYSWAHEASTYMIARCQLIIAQKNWDGYSNPIKDVDQRALQCAYDNYLLYLEEYPQGLYANSARNIRRKIFYLSGNQQALNQELKSAMLSLFPASVALNAHTNPDIVSEFRCYFRGEVDIAHDSPILIAYAWLGDQQPKAEDILSLEGREKDFLAYPGLFRYVRALGLYRLGQYQQLLDKTAEELVTKDTISLSTQLLRARSLSRIGEREKALIELKKMLNVSPEDAVEVEIAFLKLNNGDGLWLYTNQSPLKIEKNMCRFAQFGLTDLELEKGINSKEITGNKHEILVDEISRRYILSKRFKELSSLLAKDQGSGVFIPIRLTSALLGKNPKDIQALVDIGEFIYQHHIAPNTTFDGYNANYDYPMDPLFQRCQPCQEFNKRSENYLAPITFFRLAVENAQASGKKSEGEAKALHYIVRCARPGEFQTRCTWDKSEALEYTESIGKSAFIRLHRIYKKSPWAIRTPYYYAN